MVSDNAVRWSSPIGQIEKKMRSIACPASVSRQHFYISPYHHQQSVVLNMNERSCFSLRTFMRQTRTYFIVAATFALRVLYKNIQDCSWKLVVVTLLRACCTLFPYIPLYALLMIIMIPLGEGGGGVILFGCVCLCDGASLHGLVNLLDAPWQRRTKWLAFKILAVLIPSPLLKNISENDDDDDAGLCLYLAPSPFLHVCRLREDERNERALKGSKGRYIKEKEY